jgi:hypothetical protein
MKEGDLIVIGDNGTVQGIVCQVSRTSFFIEIIKGGRMLSNAVMKIPGIRI